MLLEHPGTAGVDPGVALAADDSVDIVVEAIAEVARTAPESCKASGDAA